MITDEISELPTFETDISHSQDKPSAGSLMGCLEIICSYHRIPFSKIKVLAGLPLKNNELSPSSLEKACLKLGMKCRFVKRDIEKINPALLPAILINKEQQSVVLLDIELESKTVKVIYPEEVSIVDEIKLDELKELHTGFVAFIRPTFKTEHNHSIQNVNTEKHWFWDVILSTTTLYKDILIASFFISVLSVAIPLFVMNVYDRVVPNAATETLWVLSVGVFIALFFEIVLKMMRYYFVELAASRIDVTVSSKIMQKILDYKISEKPKSTGAFVNSIHSYESVRHFLNSMSVVAFIEIPFAFIFVIIISLIHLKLVIPIFIGSTILLLYAYAVQRTMFSLSEDSIEISSARHGVLNETVSQLETIKFFSISQHILYEWERLSIYMSKVSAKMRLVNMSVSNVAALVQQAVGVFILITAVYLLIEGDITQGGIIAAYLLSGRAMSPFASCAALLAQFNHAASAYKTINDIYNRPQENPGTKKYTDHSHIRGEISLKNISFHYPGMAKSVIQNISFTVKPGEKVAILGKNSSGKSTLLKLLLKSYEPTNGLITIDGIDLQQYEPSYIRSNIGFIPQESTLLSATLKENITCFNENVSDDDIWEIIKACQLDSFVNTHPDGINMQVGEGGCLLSAGKRQAVTIARAMLKNSQIFIMDEPTSSLDSVTENLLCLFMEKHLKDKTLILTTHRNFVLKLVDRIIILDNGICVADGPKMDILKMLAKSQDISQ